MADKPIFQKALKAAQSAVNNRSREPLVETAVRVALQTVLEETPSPRTAAEIHRILAEAPAREVRGDR